MIFDEDWEFLNQEYGSDSENKLGPGFAIKQIIHAKVLQLKAAANAKYDQIRAQQGQGRSTISAGSDQYISGGAEGNGKNE